MHFLQSTAWQEFQKDLGRKTFRQTGEGWEYLAILETGLGNTRLYCPYGPTADDQRAFEEAIESLISLGRQHQVTFVRVEPTKKEFANFLKNTDWRKTTYQSLNPEHSNQLDLTLNEEELIANMAQPVRNCYRNYHKKGIKVRTSSKPADIEIFLKLIHQVAEKTGMRPQSDDYFRQQANSLFPIKSAKLWYATVKKQPVAVAIIYEDETTCYYAHAGTDTTPEYRRLNAGTAVLTEAIIDAKKRQKTIFDLYGIAPDDDTRHTAWAGFTKFKRSFGGQDVQFGGTWDFPLKPLPYFIYRAYQTIRSKRR